MKNKEKGFAIPLVIAIIAILGIGGGAYFYINKKVEIPVNISNIINNISTTTTNISDRSSFQTQDQQNTARERAKLNSDSVIYRSNNFGLEFKYYNKMTISENDNGISLSHSVPYRHVDLCDEKDGHWNDNFVDYSNKIKVYNENYISAVKKEYSYSPSGYMDNGGNLEKGNIFVGKEMINNQIFYKYFTGVEGCGQYIYILPLGNSKTVFVERHLTPPFGMEPPLYKGPFGDSLITTFKNIEGVILPEESAAIFGQILSSIKFTKETSITVISPNGGEIIPYGNIVMAGDLMFKWKTSEGDKYFPSTTSGFPGVYISTPNFKAYIVDENNQIIRVDEQHSISSLGGGIFTSSFVGDKKISTNTKYKIKICDLINGQQICDLSDGFFIIK